MQEDSLSSAPGNNSPQLDISSIVAAATHVTPLASFFLEEKKERERGFLDFMDIEEEDTTKTPKKQKIEKT